MIFDLLMLAWLVTLAAEFIYVVTLIACIVTGQPFPLPVPS
jgi:hypothetical protein